MFLNDILNSLLFYPPDSSGGDEELKIDDENELKDEDEDNEEGEKEDEEDEDKDEKEDDEEELQLTRVEFKDIKGKYPQFFKDFPELKHAFFREQQFTEIFPTVEDAKRASEAQNAYEEITAAVIDGDVDKFLSELESESKDGLENFAKNFMPSLQKTNKDLYFEIIGPQVATFIRNVYAHGTRDKDDNIKNAAKIVHKMIFGGAYEDVEKDVPLINIESKKDDKIEKDKAEYFSTKYNNLYKEVTETCYNKLDEEIGKGLIDLKGKQGLVRILSKDIRGRVLEELEKDSAYMGRMQALWKREQRNGFSGTLKSSLSTLFLAKAKTVLPKIRMEVRREALGKEIKEDKEEKETTRLSGGKESGGKGKQMTPLRAKEERLSTRQILD